MHADGKAFRFQLGSPDCDVDFINYHTNLCPILQAVNEDSGHLNVATMMESWTNQIGYPVVTINTTTGEISQKHFLFNDSAESRYVPFATSSLHNKTSAP